MQARQEAQPLVACFGPAQLAPGESGIFSASLSEHIVEDTTSVTWSIEPSGETSHGLLTERAFDVPGSYALTVTVAYKRRRLLFFRSSRVETANCPVDVLAPPTCSISASPETVSMCVQPLAPVQFHSQVAAPGPVTYRWGFGDGGTASKPDPSHTYTRTDAELDTVTYEAELTVSNSAGSSTCSVPIGIKPCPCLYPSELAPVCFDRNSSRLPVPGSPFRRMLRENIQILEEMPNTEILVVAYAAPGEDGPRRRSDDRARVVEDFYRDGGIHVSRIKTLSVVQEVASKSGPVCTLTLPMPCNDNERETFLQDHGLAGLFTRLTVGYWALVTDR